MKCYLGTKIVTAEPEKHANGGEGYRVVYPDGYASWSPKDTFEIAYREITFHERQLITQTDAEHQISAISDGEPNVEYRNLDTPAKVVDWNLQHPHEQMKLGDTVVSEEADNLCRNFTRGEYAGDSAIARANGDYFCLHCGVVQSRHL